MGSSSADEAEDQYTDDWDGTAVLAKWQQKATARKSNDISRQNQPNWTFKALGSKGRPKDIGGASKAAVKRARKQTVDSQSQDISETLLLTTKVMRHSSNDADGPVKFSMNVRHGSTFGVVPQQLAQMTGIGTPNQFLILNGEEWSTEESEIITTVWSPHESVAISEKNSKCIGGY